MSSVDRVEASRKARPSSAATIAKLMIPFEVVGKLTIVDGSIAPTHFFEDLIHIMSGLSHDIAAMVANHARSEEHTSELQSRFDLVCRLLLEKKYVQSMS